ncbi:MAG: hypothetical protein NTV34_09080 [Proteobacteria bacterium]|nr:hypothetical protein [Pseudomonadota bacterium]
MQTKYLNKIIGTLLLTLTVFGCGRWQRKASDESNSEDPNLVNSPEEKPIEADPLNDRGLRLRGYQELSQVMERSMLKTDDQFSLSYYVGGGVYPFVGPVGVAPLMGYYNSDPINSGWRNVSPNTASVSVYLIALTDFAKDVSRVCSSSDPELSNLPEVASPSAEFANLVKSYCTQGDKMAEGELFKLWKLLNAGLVPNSEFPFWTADLRTQSGESLQRRLEFLIVSAVLSPEVLFHQ